MTEARPPRNTPEPQVVPPVEDGGASTGATPPVADNTQAAALDAILAALQDARANAGDSARQDAVVNALSTLKVKDYPELAENPAFTKFLEDYHKAQVKSGRLPPGSVINKGTLAENMIPWTLNDLKTPPPG